MSGKFESKLAEWVKIADHPHWPQAAALLVKLIAAQNSHGLSTLLENMPAQRSHEFAIALLTELRAYEHKSIWVVHSADQSEAICDALSYVLDIDAARSSVASAPLEPDPDRPMRRGVGLVQTAIELVRQKRWSGRATRHKVRTTINDATVWGAQGAGYVRLLMSAAFVLGLAFESLLITLTTIAIVTLTLLATSMVPSRPAPWLYSGTVTPNIHRGWQTLLAIGFGAVTTIGLVPSMSVATLSQPTFEITLVIAALLASGVFHFGERNHVDERFYFLPLHDSHHWILVPLTCVWLLFLAIVGGLRWFFDTSLLLPTLAISTILALWLGYRIGCMRRARRDLRNAAEAVDAMSSRYGGD